eukprot:gene1461-15890_t
MREVLERLHDRPGKVLAERNFWKIRNADDTTMVARPREEYKETGEALTTVSKEVGLVINKFKTSAMAVHRDREVEIDGEIIEPVKR